LSVIPVEEWLNYVEEKLSDVEKLIDSLDALLKDEEYRKKAKVIERDNYKLEIVVIPAGEEELYVKIYCTPKVKVDPKYIFLIYFTEFFPEISSELLDPDKNKIYSKKIVLSFRIPKEFFEMDMKRILSKINRFWNNILNEDVQKELDEIIPKLYEMAKSKDPSIKHELNMLKMKINDMLLYE